MSGRINTDRRNGTNFYLRWWINGSSPTGNYTDIGWQAGINITGGAYWYSNAIRIDDGHIDGQKLGNGTWSNKSGNGDHALRSGTKRIYHASNGNKSFSGYINGWLYLNGNVSRSGSWALPSLARLPNVTSNSATNLGTSSATARGNVTWDGNRNVTQRGIVWGTSANPTTGNNRITSGSGTGSYSVTISGLNPNTTYHYRAYAINDQGTRYGANISFTTYKDPVVGSTTVSNVTGTTATATAVLSDVGSPTLTQKGFVYGTVSNPTTSNSKVIVSGTSTGSFFANLVGLNPASIYYIRAYAINSAGTVYGSPTSFQTVVPAVVVTNNLTNITTTTATAFGEVTSAGGGTVSARGFVWSTSPNPTLSDSSLQVGSGLGTFTDELTNLTPSATYYVRAYATNEHGTSYGLSKVISTAQTPPLQPTILHPANGLAIPELVPTLQWQYNTGSANDTQYSYQVQVIRQSDSTTIWDSGEIISASQEATYDGSALAYGQTYQWRVRTKNQNDQWSLYSSYSIFKASQAPTVTILTPGDFEEISNNTPIITWTYADNEGTTQAAYRLRILLDSRPLLDTGLVLNDDSSFQVPPDLLQNLTSYQIELTVRDGDGLDSEVAQRTFSIQYLAPGLPNVTVAQSEAGVTQVTVNVTEPPVEGWFTDQISIFKRLSGSLVNDLIERKTVLTKILDDGEVIANWAPSNVADAPVESIAKYGDHSVGMGSTSTGTASYTKTLTNMDLSAYNTIGAWLYITNPQTFGELEIVITSPGAVASGQVSSTIFAPGLWTPVVIPFIDIDGIESIDLASVDSITLNYNGVSEVITPGDYRLDQLIAYQSQYIIEDYETSNGQQIIYSARATSNESQTTTDFADTSIVTIKFSERYINTYLVPLGDEANTVSAFMDGTKVPNWSDETETRYYETMGRSKPIVVTRGNLSYKQGQMELRFFDPERGGLGLTGVDQLETIKNYKPILLRTWWGKNYYISIDGTVSTQRAPGIGWYSVLNFTEIGK